METVELEGGKKQVDSIAQVSHFLCALDGGEEQGVWQEGVVGVSADCCRRKLAPSREGGEGLVMATVHSTLKEFCCGY